MFRLKSLYIKDYKNIHEQTFDFSNNTGYIALIGLNGSGKSNLIEAISLIFDELYGIPHSEQVYVNGYKITYEIDGQQCVYTTLDEQNNTIPLVQGDKICPSSVIACYSGEDLRLWNVAYMLHYKDFFPAALRDKDYVPLVMYIDRYCWKIALISLLFSLNREVQQFVRDVLHIETANVTIQFTYNNIANPQPHDAYNWLEKIKQQYSNNDIPLEDLRDLGLDNLHHINFTEDKVVFFYLYFLFMPSKMPELSVKNLITNITIKLGDLEFDALSEGEKKMILVACINYILGDENSLVLLDEPDAHVHIENKKKILETITQYNGQTIFTTHSPIFTSLMECSNIFPIEKGMAINAEQRDLIAKMANNNINFIDGAYIISSKYLVLTEGSSDIKYITAAITACGIYDIKYKVLEKVSFVYIGGANQVEDFYNNILSTLYATLDNIVFVFDYDSKGREGAKQVQKLIDNGKNKIKTLYYNVTYPINQNQDFYLEDLFKRKIYNDIQLPFIEGEPTYAQLKKGNTLANSIKDKIAKLYNSKSLHNDDFYTFRPFLDQLIQLLNL